MGPFGVRAGARLFGDLSDIKGMKLELETGIGKVFVGIWDI